MPTAILRQWKYLFLPVAPLAVFLFASQLFEWNATDSSQLVLLPAPMIAGPIGVTVSRLPGATAD